MRTESESRRFGGFTLLEVLVILFMVLLLLVALSRYVASKHRAQRISCIGNLKIIGLSIRAWGIDRGDQFPWVVSSNRGGTLEYASSPETFRHFHASSNDLGTPRVLVCPCDHARLRVNQFVPPISNANISYFLGLDADETSPQMILSGDRNLTGGASNVVGFVFKPTDVAGWDAGFHHFEGNMGLADGSVQQVDEEKLVKQFAAAFRSKPELGAMQFAIPRVRGEKAASDGVLFGTDVPVPLVGAVVIGTGLLVAWWLVRRRILADAAETSVSDAGTPSESLKETGPK